MASTINLFARSRLVGIVRMSGACASTLVFTNALVPRGVSTATASPPNTPASHRDSVDAGLGAAGFGHDTSAKLSLVIRIVLLVAAGGVTYVGVALLLGMDEIRQVFRMLLERRRSGGDAATVPVEG